MATSQLFLVCDASTVTNFKASMQAVSNWFRSCGYTNTTDTGQLGGAGGNNWAGVSTAPSSGSYYYEIFQSAAGLTTYLVKAEYGVAGSGPTLRFTLCQTTNGAGTPTGNQVGPLKTNAVAFTVPSTTATYECNFSGDTSSNRISVMLHRNSPSGNNCNTLFAIERSIDGTTGAYTGEYVTLWTLGTQATNNSTNNQQTLHFVVGAAPGMFANVPAMNWGCRIPATQSSVSSTFNGSIPFDTAAPYVGFWDWNGTSVGVCQKTDITEGITFGVTLYGSTKTYMPSFIGAFNNFGFSNNLAPNGMAVCMRYD